MPSFVEFGGTNGVAILDIGLPGGNLHSNWPLQGAYATMEWLEGPATSPAEESAMPDGDFVAVQRGGFHGKTIRASGVIQSADHETLNGIMDAIKSREFNPVQMVPTRLQNYTTVQTWDEVILRNFRAGSPRSLGADGAVVMEYELEFHILRGA